MSLPGGRDPHGLLGPHAEELSGVRGTRVRAFHPEASGCFLVQGRTVLAMTSDGGGLVSVFLPRELGPFPYRIRFRFPNGLLFEREDPYRFQPTLGKLDLHLMSEGKHHQLWKRLGAQYRVMDGVRGTSFAVWAPNAKRVSVVGDFNLWDGRLYPMRALGSSGVWELFIPEVGPGSLYKYELEMQSGELRLKADPLATWP